MALDRADIEEKLLNKFGFETVPGSNHDAVAFFYENKKIATVRFSRGKKGSNIPDGILTMMSRQAQVNQLGYFKKMIQCTRSKDDYISLLKDRGFIT